METIRVANEEAFLTRYGLSLTKMWQGLTEDEQKKAVSDFCEISASAYESSLSFEQQDALRIVIGYGGTKCIEEICKNALPSMRALIWEPEKNIFLAACVIEDIHEYIEDERLTIYSGRGDAEDLKGHLADNLLVTNAFHSKIMAFGPYASPDDKDVEILKSCYTSVAAEVLGEGNSLKHFHHLSCENWLNAIGIVNDNYLIGQLFECIRSRDIPIIIVAAGPSLVKNCMDLKNAAGKSIIISVTHALNTLYCNGIMPDMLAVTDAAPFNYADCGVDKDHFMISSVYAAKKDQNSYNGRVVFWGFRATESLFRTKRITDYPETPCGTGSVATDIFLLFADAGFRKFILVGQDLAYDDEGYSHSDGKKESFQMVMECEGLDGNIVKTRSDWDDMRRFYEKKIDEYSDITVIDATEGGARIDGTRIMTLKDAVSSLCDKEYPVNEWLTMLKPGDDEEKEYVDGWFDDCISDCVNFSRYLDKVIDQNRKIAEKWNDTEKWDGDFRKLCKSYDVMYNIIMNGNSGFVIKKYCIREIQKYVENALVFEGDGNTVKRMGLEYDLFSFMQNASDELMECIKSIRGCQGRENNAG